MIKRDRIKLIEEMLATNNEDPFLNYAAALEYNKLGERKKAIKILEGIIKVTPDYLGGYYQLGKLFEEENKNKKAIAVYKKGRKIATVQQNQKTLGELNEALMLIDDDFDGSL